jgi:hypothetical protein
MSNLTNETAATALQRGAAEGTAFQIASELSYPSPSTVKGRVLGDLLAGRTITHKDTWVEHGSSRLAHHVYALRRDGWPVDMVEREVPTSDSGRSAAIGFYSLSQKAIAQAGERGQRYVAAVRAQKGGAS